MAKVLLGVCGGIAAYKTPELARLLRKAGHEVDVVLTEAAAKLVAPAALAAVTGRPVRSSMWEGVESGRMDHIDLAASAERVIVAPATADFLARAAAGRASDLLSACLLVTRAPLLLAPAMNTCMWEHPFTRRNVAALSALPNVRWVGPEAGELACGWEGPGRMADPATIVAALERMSKRDLEGRSLLVTAGPTREPLDPVRYLGNRSSGRMGQALAEAAARRGAKVTLVRGPVDLPPPGSGVKLVEVTTTEEMRREVLARWRKVNAVVMAAAVADWRAAHVAPQKLKRTGETTTLELRANPDILAELGRRRGDARRPLLVGFCVETADLAEAARAKLAAKRCDLLVANLAQEALGLPTARVEIHRPGKKPLGPFEGPKADVAENILDVVAPLL
ncbi:MAG: bifunctional phosphopantothenoylcysteine decarboxylase/phosphopantothenate--cysteine ligase CoaBC [Deltaproteobacteria bacterium]|nr:bifunctional phosphopantothenoylcysteine decarboxylase/phosphopantothenate--cysteine ligase CoaBC [Deltaproteobacteria bacterium]